MYRVSAMAVSGLHVPAARAQPYVVDVVGPVAQETTFVNRAEVVGDVFHHRTFWSYTLLPQNKLEEPVKEPVIVDEYQIPALRPDEREFLEFIGTHAKDSVFFKDDPKLLSELDSLVCKVYSGQASLGALVDFIWRVQVRDYIETLLSQHPEKQIRFSEIPISTMADPIDYGLDIDWHALSGFLEKMPDLHYSSDVGKAFYAAYNSDQKFRAEVDRLITDMDWRVSGRLSPVAARIYLFSEILSNLSEADVALAQAVQEAVVEFDHPDYSLTGYEIEFPYSSCELENIKNGYSSKREDEEPVLTPAVLQDNLNRMLSLLPGTQRHVNLAYEDGHRMVVRLYPPRVLEQLAQSLFGDTASRWQYVAGEVDTETIVEARRSGRRVVGVMLDPWCFLEDDGSYIHAATFTNHDVVHGLLESAVGAAEKIASYDIYQTYALLPEDKATLSGGDDVFFTDFSPPPEKYRQDPRAVLLIAAFRAFRFLPQSPDPGNPAITSFLSSLRSFRETLRRIADPKSFATIDRALEYVEGRARLRKNI